MYLSMYLSIYIYIYICTYIYILNYRGSNWWRDSIYIYIDMSIWGQNLTCKTFLCDGWTLMSTSPSYFWQGAMVFTPWYYSTLRHVKTFQLRCSLTHTHTHTHRHTHTHTVRMFGYVWGMSQGPQSPYLPLLDTLSLKHGNQHDPLFARNITPLLD